jgi:hypothetical protein
VRDHKLAHGRNVFDPETGRRRCTADKVHQPGNRCGLAPRTGTVVCGFHGGAAPQVQAAAARGLYRNEIEKKARNAIAKAGYEPVEDPVEKLSEVAGRVIAFMEAVDGLVDLSKARYEHHAGEQLRAEVALFERSLDRSAKILESIIKLDLAGRRQKVEEAKILLVMAAIDKAFSRVGTPAVEKAKVIQVFREELSALSAEA